MPKKTPLDQLPGVSAARRELLGRLGLETVDDLLFHFPRTYEDLSDLRSIARLTPGQPQTIQGEVIEMDSRTLSNGGSALSITLCDDGQSVLEGIWFNQPHLARRFRYGQRLSFSGKPKWYRDHWQMTSPRVQILDGNTPSTPGIVPVYPLTEKLRTEQLRPLIGRALELYASTIPEILPAVLLDRHGWPRVVEALRWVHFPETLEQARRGRSRFLYQEVLLIQLALGLRRRELRDARRAPVLQCTSAIDERIRRLFPFALTNDQNQAIQEVCRDLASDRPMQRLVQADVGAGKTAIAVYALLVAVACKHQAAMMAPTEVLARQHARTLERYLAHSRVRRLLLTGALSARERQQAHEAIRAGEVDLVIGTQALVQEGVRFANLGLVVIDEQHRFGVHQRARIRRLGNSDPHYLVMTATPIPRTVALTVFGDLDVSTVKQLPPGRQPVTTRWLREPERDWLFDKVRQELAAGRQGYIVCPLVDGSEEVQARSASQVYKELTAGPLRDARIGLLHGQQDEAVKADVMDRFSRHEIDLLVCTTVVEVGVDVPNATLMVVENAERFGLSQLHQLRGRVSRGSHPGWCWLFANPASDDGKERLRIFIRTTDGFALAEEDARLRGMGELFGTKQHGTGELLALGMGSMELLQHARKDAFEMLAQDAQLSSPEVTGLRAEVFVRYGQTLELSEVG